MSTTAVSSAPATPQPRRNAAGEHAQIRLCPAADAYVSLEPGQPWVRIAVPSVTLAAHELLVAIELSTLRDGELDLADPAGPVRRPFVPGRESVGRVINIGAGGSAAVGGSALSLGDRIVWAGLFPCATCTSCRSGAGCVLPQRFGGTPIGVRELSGGMASHAHLPAGALVVRVPESVPAAVLAPAARASATAWSAVQQLAQRQPLAGMRLRVEGAGLTGLTVAAMAHSHGALVEVRDPDAARREQALRFGAVPGFLESDPDAVVLTSIGADGDEATVCLPARTPVRVSGEADRQGRLLSGAVAFLAGRGAAYPFDELVSAVHPLSAVVALAAEPVDAGFLRIAVAAR